jgi:serine-type D-Ala-D-Ala carboxypeptidase
MTVTHRLQRHLDDGVSQGVFPSAQAVVLADGQTAFEGAAGTADLKTVFDLASLTKIICTTSLFMRFWTDGLVQPPTSLASLLGGTKAGGGGASVQDLLYHRSGLPDFIPFFAPVMKSTPRLFDPECPAEIRIGARAEVVAAAMATEPRAPVSLPAVYSDVGFILLGEGLSRLVRAPLDWLYREEIATPLALSAHFRRLSHRRHPAVTIAPTGRTRPREPAPGQEGQWKLESHPSQPGEVDDDNAWAMDGVAGHAGLFGTAWDVAKFGQAILEELNGAGRLAPKFSWEVALSRDPLTPATTRAMGFDTVHPGDREASSAGTLLGQRSPGAVGHTGFTGVSLWVDLARKLVVALCTNRTFLGRGNLRIRQFRPNFHDSVIETLSG